MGSRNERRDMDTMPRVSQKQKAEREAADINNWITSAEAAQILTDKSGHEVKADYVRRLALADPPHIERRVYGVGRVVLYSRSDVEAYTVKPKGDGSVRRAARTKKGSQVESTAADVAADEEDLHAIFGPVPSGNGNGNSENGKEPAPGKRKRKAVVKA